jgi:hypothetical protein
MLVLAIILAGAAPMPGTDLTPSPAARVVDAAEWNETGGGLHQLIFWQGGKAIGWCHASDAKIRPLRDGWQEVTVSGRLPLIRTRVVVSSYTERDPETWLRADKTIPWVPAPVEARAEEP